MKTIVFAASKGGVGKTTLAFNVAIEAAKHGTVFLVDMDPQKSLETFCEIRGGNNPLLLQGVESIPRAIADLKRTGYSRDFLIVDTPGSFMNIIEDAVSAADCVVLPLQPSPVDIIAQEDVLKLVARLHKTEQTLCALTRVDGRTAIDDIVSHIKTLFANKHVAIKNRIAYSRALVKGRTGPEADKDCTAEITGLWTSIQKIIGDDHGKIRHHDAEASLSEGRPGQC